MGIDRGHPDYTELRARIRENPMDFVAVVGAGLSRSCGLPTWAELRDNLVEDARGRAPGMPVEERSGREAALTRLAETDDLWQAFGELQRMLPKQAYEQVIRDSLQVRDRSSIPLTYDLLWKLGIKGVVTFNLDTCAVDSFARVHQCCVDTSTAMETAVFPQFLLGSRQFVLQPHGVVSDPSSWVFTIDERTRILGTKSYIDFMKALCQAKNLLFVGLNPRDFAFEYVVQQALGKRTTSGGRRYIFLASADRGRQLALADLGFCVIPYLPTDPDAHPEVEESLSDFLAFVPRDGLAASVFTGEKADPSSLPDDEELLRRPLDDVRMALNGAVAAIIPPGGSPTAEDMERLELFYAEHLRAIHMAWLIQPDSDCDCVHGYRAIRHKGRGAFGQVYEAENLESGDRVAIKVLLPEVRREREYLNSFRRGVGSMRILTARGVDRMVRIIDAFEVPACVVMDYIDGPTLTEAVTWGLVDDLSTALEVLGQIGDVVHSAHDLEERVLHRDLKPDNVILRDGYTKASDSDVVVVDFDLSWHKGASDLSVVEGARAQGYAAPEQTATGRLAGVSTRHTAVDAFGYGMLAFFVFVGENPRPNEQNFPGFEVRVRDAIRRRLPSKWRSLPAHLANVVVECTHDEQQARMPFSSAVAAFRNAGRMALADCIDATDPLLLEELAAIISPDVVPNRMDFGRRVVVSSSDAAKVTTLSLVGNGDQISVHVQIHKARTAADPRGIAKYLERAKDKAVSRLDKHAFAKVRGTVGHGTLEVVGEWPLDRAVVRAEIQQVADLIQESQAAMDLG